MKILFLTQVLPYPLDAGPKVRAYWVLRHLAESGHEITLLSFVRGGDTGEHVDHLRQYCAAVRTVPMRRSRLRDGLALALSLASGIPFLIARDREPAMARAIRELSGATRFDAVHADQLWMAPYALLARRSSPRGHTPSVVLDQHNAVCSIPGRMADAETNQLKRALLRLEAAKLARYERETCRSFDRVVWVTEEDRRTLFPDGDQEVIPIALDGARRAPVRPRSAARRVTFIGGLHWPPNAQGILWFRDAIWPRVCRAAPGALLTVIGKDAPAGLKNSRDDSLEVTGYVPDTAPYLEETAVFIVPLRAGGGMRVKILEAWSWGIPVVSTTIGAEGLHTRNGDNILLADHPPAFAAAVVELINNPKLAARLSAGGIRTIESHYDRRNIYAAWNEIYPCASFTSSLTRPA